MATSNTKTIKKVIPKRGKNVDKSKKQVKKTGRPKFDPMVSFLPKMERYLILGYSVSKAAMLSGLPHQTVSDHYRENEAFRQAVDGLINAPNVKARANWVNEINRGNYGASTAWLAAREKDEFSTRTEQTGKDGEPLTTPIEVTFVAPDKKK